MFLGNLDEIRRLIVVRLLIIHIVDTNEIISRVIVIGTTLTIPKAVSEILENISSEIFISLK